MTLAAIRTGWRQAISGRRMVFWIWLLGMAASIPAAVVMQQSFEGAIGSSQVHEDLRNGLDMPWLFEYAHGAHGIEKSVTASRLTKAGFLDNLEAWFTGKLFATDPALVGMGVLYALGWTFLLGGLLEQLIRPVPKLTLAHFFQSGGRFFGRFVRLVVLSAPLYYLIYKGSRKLFATIESATRDVTAETSVLAFNLAGAVLIIGLLMLVNMSFTYAKISMVFEDRRSALGTALRGIGFVLAHPVRTAGVYLGIALGSLVLLAAYWVVAPGLGGGHWITVLWAFLLAQLYLVAKLTVRVAFFAGQTDLYRQTVHPAPEPEA